MSLNTETKPEAKSPAFTQDTYTAFRQRFHDDEINYQRLNGNVQAIRSRPGVWDTDYTVERYVGATDNMIGVLDGSISERALYDPIDPERSAEKPDTVIWLDKSSRPVSWFVDAFWDQFADEDAEKPTDEFLNIDRVNWFVKQGHLMVDAKSRLGPQDFDINKVPEEELAGLRAIFTIGDLSEDNWQEEVWNLPTRLDGKNILVVDEVKNKGGTLSIATQLINRVFPGTTVSGDYFWKTASYSLGGVSAAPADLQMESAPVWYDSENSYGRGVGEISLDYWKHLYEVEPTQDNLKKKLGSFALSAPHFDRETYETVEDTLAMKLEQDIAYLSYAVADKKVLRVPSKERPIDQIEEILNEQDISFSDYRNYREARSRKPNDKVVDKKS